MVVVELFAEDGAEVGEDDAGALFVAGVAVGEGYLLHEQGVLEGGEGYLDEGLVEGREGLPCLAAVGEVVGEDDNILPVLLEELAAGLVEVDIVEGVPPHAVVEVVEEGVAVDGILGVVSRSETEGVAFEEEAAGDEMLELALGVVGVVDGAAGGEALLQELGVVGPAHEADILDTHIEAFLLDGLEVPKGEGIVVAV